MNTDRKQFHSSLQAFKNARLDAAKKNRIFSEVADYAHAHHAAPRLIPSPYALAASFFYKPLAAVLMVLFFISGGTALAAESSLPGDFLYAVKTKVTEPLTRLTKVSPQAKATFALALADKRIEEMQKLTEENRLTETGAEENFALFEMHMQQYAQYEQDTPNISLSDRAAKTNIRLERYQTIISSVPQLTTFYADSEETLLQLIVPILKINKTTPGLQDADVENKHDVHMIPESNPSKLLDEETATGTQINVETKGAGTTGDRAPFQKNPILDTIEIPSL